MFANLTSTLWARLAQGRAKATVLAALQAVLLIVLVGIALLPAEPSSAVALVVFYVIARCVFAGVLTTADGDLAGELPAAQPVAHHRPADADQHDDARDGPDHRRGFV